MAKRIEAALGSECFDVEVMSDDLTGTLSDILQVKDRSLTEADASQVAYAQSHSGTTRLYMRDGPAQRQARMIGAPVFSHEELVEEMESLGLITRERGADLRRRLTGHFRRRRGRSADV